MENTEELLKPRFEIIADYPGCPYNVGRILTPATKQEVYYECKEAPASQLIPYPEKYPAVFRKLNWWEHRKEEDMPIYLKSLATGGYEKIEKWDMSINFGFVDANSRSGCDLTVWNPEYGYVPVTEEEYLTNLNTNP